MGTWSSYGIVPMSPGMNALVTRLMWNWPHGGKGHPESSHKPSFKQVSWMNMAACTWSMTSGTMPRHTCENVDYERICVVKSLIHVWVMTSQWLVTDWSLTAERPHSLTLTLTRTTPNHEKCNVGTSTLGNTPLATSRQKAPQPIPWVGWGNHTTLTPSASLRASRLQRGGVL